MKIKIRLAGLRGAGLVLALVLAGASFKALGAEAYEADLGQASEFIDKGLTNKPVIPANAPEMTTYPIPPDRARPLLTEVPGKPYRQVEPVPERRAWWKYPFYLGLGLPRDLADAFVGTLSNVPILNLPLVYLPYEVVPTQILLRDPRDWHRWPGRRNRRGHGMIDSDFKGIIKDNSWGWFPSLHSWHFTYPSKRLQRKNQAYNEALTAELRGLNQELDRENQAIANRQREARAKALAAIEAGDGREAALRMIPFKQAQPLDEGAFSLFATGLGLYWKGAPLWVGNLLWHELNTAQLRQLTQAESLMAKTAAAHPENAGLTEALIYTRLLLNQNDGAREAARELLNKKPTTPEAAPEAAPMAARLAFETALSVRDPALAQEAITALGDATGKGAAGAAGAASTGVEDDRTLMKARLALLTGKTDEAKAALEQLQQRRPEDAYLDYYLGVARLEMADTSPSPAATYRRAFDLLEKAALRGTHPAIRQRAGKALAYARGVLAGVGEKPEAFEDPAVPTFGGNR